MFEAKFEKASTFKKIIEAMKELVAEGKFECTASGVSLQAMDAAHVSLVQMLLKASGFASYRCERNVSLGLSLETLSKVLKCAMSDDTVTIRADEDSDSVQFIFESPRPPSFPALFVCLVFRLHLRQGVKLRSETPRHRC